jgi:hydrocephalus-inducing protein
MLYNLKGVATAPQSEGTIQETVQARKQKNFKVNVKNWAKKTQRFEASWKVEGPQDPSLFIRGANTFDIAGESSKEYKLNFLALKSGVYKFNVTFKENTTGEYIFYQFQVTVEESKDLEKVELVSAVRESCS